MIFNSPEHERLFTKELAKHEKKMVSRSFLAALFVLTANKKLQQRVSGHIEGGEIHWKSIVLRGIGVQEYALFKLAKDLCQNTGNIIISDLYDAEIFDDRTVRLVYAAIDIRRHGRTAVKNINRKKE